MTQRCWISIILLVIITTCNNDNQILEGLKFANAVSSHLANKPKGTVKTIKTEHGDVIDCVDIYQQPAFSNPLLKNHSLQLRPTSIPRGIKLEDNNSSMFVENWSCLEGTVPIRRPLKNESAATALRKAWPFNASSNPTKEIHKYAAVVHRHNTADIHGISATLNLWNPSTENRDFSLAQVWITNDLKNGQKEALEAGWMIYPDKFGDHETRLFIFYTNDGYKTPCYNLECNGFRLVNQNIELGKRVPKPYSVYNGAQQEIIVEIVQDLSTKDWWFYYEGQKVGYWPASLFKGLSTAANGVQWGGEIVEAPGSNHPTTTQMGSGRFAEEGNDKAAYIRGLFYLDNKYSKVIPDPVNNQVTHPGCYTATKLAKEAGGTGAFFYFGGPGRSQTCK